MPSADVRCGACCAEPGPYGRVQGRAIAEVQRCWVKFERRPVLRVSAVIKQAAVIAMPVPGMNERWAWERKGICHDPLAS